MIDDDYTAAGGNHSGIQTRKVAIQPHGVCEAMNPFEWPSGEFFRSVLKSVDRLESSNNPPVWRIFNGTTCTPNDVIPVPDIDLAIKGEEGEESDAVFWQVAARRALLLKFGYLPMEEGNGNDYLPNIAALSNLPFQPNEISLIQQRWKDAVQEAYDLKETGITTRSSDAGTDVTNIIGIEGKIIDRRNFDNLEPTVDKNIDFVDFILSQCCISNQRQLQWSVMTCPSGVQFQLHAHPNIELIYCIRGSLHEIRMNGAPFTRTFEERRNNLEINTDNSVTGPNLTYLKRSWSFATLNASQWLVNEIGSIHKSFTSSKSDGGCILLVLWGGSHANILDPPEYPNIQNAFEAMDERLKQDSEGDYKNTSCCSDTSSNVIRETFLPFSEKSTK
jgi:hypothetical protein